MTTHIVRFAPSPTGYLHIGGARTALFNYLYAKHNKGKFLLRIEDTDLKRSTQSAVEAILNGLKWLNITPDEKPTFQMQRQARHIQCALQLLESNNAYKCYCTKEELEAKRKKAESEGRVYSYERICRNRDISNIPQDTPFSIRIKTPLDGTTEINDLVIGDVKVQNSTIDDFILLRSDKTPTYMFAVVVDDHDMNITCVIRGDDHFTNTFRQYQIFKAFKWNIPQFAHLPLIYSSDGSKMSKRHGAVAVEDYKEMGFLPEAVKNYLLRLGWSHGNDEIISSEQAIQWFDLAHINKSPARFDMMKLKNINFHYMQKLSNEKLLKLMQPFIEKINGIKHKNYKNYLLNGLEPLKKRSKTIVELVENSKLYILTTPFNLNDEAKSMLKGEQRLLEKQKSILTALDNFDRDNIYNTIKDFSKENDITLGDAAKGLRILLSGEIISPASIFDIMATLGKEESLHRLNHNYN